MDPAYVAKAEGYIETLCNVKPHRRVGSAGNRAATDFFKQKTQAFGHQIEAIPFKCLDYQSKQPQLTCQGTSFDVKISPYSLGCEATAPLTVATTVEELEKSQCTGKILLLKGEICAEQLMPKNFVLYNPDHHKNIYALLEEKQPRVIITATGKNPQMVGNIYPFPLINDGDFDIPSVYCTDVVGEEIAAKAGEEFKLKAEAIRIPATACNVVARVNPQAQKKITVCAHIDAVEETQGASDNASGVTVLLLLAELLKNYDGERGVEIVALNGEDHYSVGGQMDYLNRYRQGLSHISVAINIDDVGYFRGKTAYSFYGCPEQTRQKAQVAFGKFAGLLEGEQWYQGDHMIFAQSQVPTIAVTSDKVQELMATITHSPRDTPGILDYNKLVELAFAIEEVVRAF